MKAFRATSFLKITVVLCIKITGEHVAFIFTVEEWHVFIEDGGDTFLRNVSVFLQYSKAWHFIFISTAVWTSDLKCSLFQKKWNRTRSFHTAETIENTGTRLQISQRKNIKMVIQINRWISHLSTKPQSSFKCVTENFDLQFPVMIIIFKSKVTSAHRHGSLVIKRLSSGWPHDMAVLSPTQALLAYTLVLYPRNAAMERQLLWLRCEACSLNRLLQAYCSCVHEFWHDVNWVMSAAVLWAYFSTDEPSCHIVHYNDIYGNISNVQLIVIWNELALLYICQIVQHFSRKPLREESTLETYT
jgi:hypothetical protein